MCVCVWGGGAISTPMKVQYSGTPKCGLLENVKTSILRRLFYVPTRVISPLKSGHLSNQDTLLVVRVSQFRGCTV